MLRLHKYIPEHRTNIYVTVHPDRFETEWMFPSGTHVETTPLSGSEILRRLCEMRDHGYVVL